MNKAIFLDRDGTINVEVNYLHECEKLRLIPGVVKALKLLKKQGYKLIVISNQSGVGRGYFTYDDVVKVNEYLNEVLRKDGTEIDAFYCCPHTEEDNCDCRKPKTGLYKKAVKEHDIDITNSYMVGDKVSDILAADEMGCGYGLLLSGHDIDEKDYLKYKDYCYKDLLEFAQSL